jgi:hypothetical protein
VLILAVTVFGVHFLRYSEFGLYEDDFWSVANEMGKPVRELWGIALYHFQAWHTGRPLNHLLPTALGRLGYPLGGVQALYAIGAVWLVLNAYLAFVVARRFLPLAPALVTGLAYILFPADSTKILLIHIAHVQGAMTFLLLGLVLWTRESRWRWASYPVAAISLLSYETAFLPFLCAPLLLLGSPLKHQVRRWLEHILACGSLLAAFAAIRFKTGDSRAAEAAGNLGESIHRCLTSLYLGPKTSGSSFIYSTITGYQHLSVAILLIGIGLFGVIIVLACRPCAQEDAATGENPRPAHQAVWLGLAALLAWSASYALTLVNYPPTQTVGRITSVHVAAGWPAALFVGALAFLVGTGGKWVVRSALSLAAVVFLGLFSYHQYLQAEYIGAWTEEKFFWSQIVEMAPDADYKSSIIVAGSPSPRISPVIGSNSWADYHACQRIYGTDASGVGPQFANLSIVGGSVLFRKRGELVEWGPKYWENTFVPIDPDNLILFESDKGVLRRVTSIDVSIGKLESKRPLPQVRRQGWPKTVVSEFFRRVP